MTIVYVALNQVVPPLTKLSEPELKDKHAGWEKSWWYINRSQSVTREFKI